MKVRFAPSPTGYLHVGNARIAIANALFARHAGARFLLRLDDTDPERSRPEYEDAIRQDLAWLGISWDETFAQRERLAAYDVVAIPVTDAGKRLVGAVTIDDVLDRVLPPNWRVARHSR